MNQRFKKIKASELKQGDILQRDSDLQVLTVSKITEKGFQPNSIFIDYKEGGWTSIPKNAKVTIIEYIN